MELCIEGFLNHQPNGLTAQADMATVKEQSLILLYRLLFIMYAEDRNLLPLRTNPLYRTNRCLSRLRDEIAAGWTTSTTAEASLTTPAAAIVGDIASLFDLIDKGGKRYGVPAYTAGCSTRTKPVSGRQGDAGRIPGRVIDQLSRAPDTEHPSRPVPRGLRDLAIQHLGHIYEGLLELQPNHATERWWSFARLVASD